MCDFFSRYVLCIILNFVVVVAWETDGMGTKWGIAATAEHKRIFLERNKIYFIIVYVFVADIGI